MDVGLSRFIRAQDDIGWGIGTGRMADNTVYSRAVAEVKAGDKCSHW